MGDRANVVVVDNGERVYLYTHWSGHDLPDTVRRALVRGEGRWTDAPYLTRIIFCEMIGKDGGEGTTGFGISTRIGDNEYPIIVVDCDAQQVFAEAEGSFEIRGEAPRFSIVNYAKLDLAEWSTLDTGRKD